MQLTQALDASDQHRRNRGREILLDALHLALQPLADGAGCRAGKEGDFRVCEKNI
ncbi:hypothetical protein LP417_10225 [Polaromonas sp. P1-6]|nr:hypothetical protein LP417_10225 [Polaromonas sp. P1-6]